MTPRLLSIPEAADALGCSDNHVYRLIAAGQLRSVDISRPGSQTSKTRIRVDDLAAYIDHRTAAAPKRRPVTA